MLMDDFFLLVASGVIHNHQVTKITSAGKIINKVI